MRPILGTGVALVLGLAGLHAEKTPRPGPGPQLTTATAREKEGKVLLEISLYELVPTTIETIVEVDGKVTKQVVNRIDPVEKKVSYTVDNKKVRVTTADGKAVEPNRLPALLGKGGVVLLSQTGKVSPAYLQAVKDQTLIVVIAQE